MYLQVILFKLIRHNGCYKIDSFWSWRSILSAKIEPLGGEETYPLSIRVALLQSSRGIRRAHSLRLTSNLLSSNILFTVPLRYVPVSRRRRLEEEMKKSAEEKIRTTRPDTCVSQAVAVLSFRVWLTKKNWSKRENSFYKITLDSMNFPFYLIAL